MAPEIWEGKSYTEKSDIWSLGVILYEMCTLEKPFMAENEDKLKLKVFKEKFKNPEVQVPKDLMEII